MYFEIMFNVHGNRMAATTTAGEKKTCVHELKIQTRRIPFGMLIENVVYVAFLYVSLSGCALARLRVHTAEQ